jgi:hypothetical protein
MGEHSPSVENVVRHTAFAAIGLVAGAVSWIPLWLILGSYFYPGTHPELWGPEVGETLPWAAPSVGIAVFLVLELRALRRRKAGKGKAA